MRRVLLISPYLPGFPQGSSARLASNLRMLRRWGFSVHLVLARRDADRYPIPPIARRLVDELGLLELGGLQASGVVTQHLRRELGELGRASNDPGQSMLASHRVAKLVRSSRPDIVWIDHSHLAPLAPAFVCDGALRIVDTHDVLHLRDATLRAAGLPAEAGIDWAEETRLLNGFDIVLAIQSQERHVLAEMLPGAQVIMLGHSVAIEPQPCSRPSVCFVGSGYIVNVSSILRFILGPWREIRRGCPESRLEIAGGVSRTEPLLEAAARDERIVLRGIVPTLRQLYEGPAVVICPLWMGSGLKIKMVEALAHGKAVVATPIASQGLEDGCGSAYWLAKSAEDFAEPVTALLTDERQRRQLEQAAVSFAERFRPECVAADLKAAILQLRPAIAPNGPHPALAGPEGSPVRQGGG